LLSIHSLESCLLSSQLSLYLLLQITGFITYHTNSTASETTNNGNKCCMPLVQNDNKFWFHRTEALQSVLRLCVSSLAMATTLTTTSTHAWRGVHAYSGAVAAQIKCRTCITPHPRHRRCAEGACSCIIAVRVHRYVRRVCTTTGPPQCERARAVALLVGFHMYLNMSRPGNGPPGTDNTVWSTLMELVTIL
jgi:hypothetical protein